ncbi:MAG: reverse transcriptase domain-containing protein, partial [Pseudomonadota bacterium]
MHNPNVICITETWGNNQIPDSSFFVPGYNMYRRDRECGRGGGVLLYVKDCLLSHSFNFFINEMCEAISCKISCDSADGDILFVCVYRPPHHVLVNSSLIDYLKDIVEVSNNFVICGDFNCPDINWSLLHRSSQSSPLFDWAMNNFLVQGVTSPTRPASGSILDLVFFPVTTPVSNVNVHERFGDSDHAVITFSVDIPIQRRPTEDLRRMRFHKAKWSTYRRCLQQSQWNHGTGCSVDVAWNKCLDNLSRASVLSIPTATPKSWTPFTCSRVRTAARHCRRSYSALRSDPSFFNRLTFRRSFLMLERAISFAIVSFERLVVCDKSRRPNLFWNYVRNKVKARLPFSSMKLDNGDTLTDSHIIAENFSELFCSNFTSSPVDISASSASYPCTITLSGFVFTTKMVYDVIKNLPASTTVDPDGLTYLHLKKGGVFLASKLCDIFNLSLSTACMPESWRNVIITPVHKKGSKSTFSNYRPVAVTSVACRVMERIIVSHMSDFLMSSGRIHFSQHGFLPKRSVETAGVVFANFLLKNLDQAKDVDVVMLDFSKAFEKVSHTHLICKLRHFGFCDPLLSWISDFL